MGGSFATCKDTNNMKGSLTASKRYYRYGKIIKNHKISLKT